MTKLLLLISLFSTISLKAQEIPLANLTEEQFRDVIGEFSANFHHTPVSSAASLGAIFGFEVGIVGGISQVPRTNDLIQAADATADEVDTIPHAAILARVSVPLGFTGELTFIPSIDLDDIKLDSRGIGIAWDSSLIWSLPVTLGFKFTYSSTEFTFTTQDPGSGAPIDANYESTVTGLYAFVSKDLLVIEPYFGLGTVSGEGELSASASLFGFTTATSASEKESSTHLILGANVNLLFINLGLEYGRLFDTSKYTAKVSFGF